MVNLGALQTKIKILKQTSIEKYSKNFLLHNRCSVEKFIELALTLFFKRQQHRKLSWLDKDSAKDQSQFDFSIEHLLYEVLNTAGNV
jgi:hypothetical protein